MAILQGLLAAIFHSLGRILNTAFGWATILLFGKVPARKQVYLSAASLASLVWFLAALSIAFPRVGAFLLAFVVLPEWVEDSYIRIAMLVAAVAIPAIVGGLSIAMHDAEDRPRGVGGKVMAVLRGYPYTIGLALTFVLMMVFAPILRLQAAARRWTSQHVPIVVEPEDYMTVLSDVEKALATGGVETRREQATWMLRVPTKVLSFFAGSTVSRFIADQLTTLRGESLEVILHPSDLLVRGPQATVAHLQAILAERLTFTKAYLTYEKEAHELEDRLREIWEGARRAGTGRFDRPRLEALRAVEKDLRKLEVPFEEWEVLLREKLQVERALLGTALGLEEYREPTAVERLAEAA
ncbi:MAG TPA: hypothetical protein VFF73_30530 [Planctomycetota bacterium]|nr:hypothetical protein [Planctomycetota bacterium]